MPDRVPEATSRGAGHHLGGESPHRVPPVLSRRRPDRERREPRGGERLDRVPPIVGRPGECEGVDVLRREEDGLAYGLAPAGGVHQVGAGPVGSEPGQARQGHAREGKTGAGRRRRHAGAGGDEDRRMHPDVQHDAVGQAPARLQGLVAGGDHEHGHGRGPEANRTGKPPHSGGAAPPAIKARIVRMVPSSSERRAGTRPRRRTAESPVAMPRQARRCRAGPARVPGPGGPRSPRGHGRAWGNRGPRGPRIRWPSPRGRGPARRAPDSYGAPNESPKRAAASPGHRHSLSAEGRLGRRRG